MNNELHSDRCAHCPHRFNMKQCKSVSCIHRQSWYIAQLQEKIDTTKKLFRERRIQEAVDFLFSE